MAVVEVLDGAGAYGPDATGLRVDAAALAAQAHFLLDRLGMHPDCELVISLVDEAEMADLHQRWMGEPGPTDVLSFPMDELAVPAAGEISPPGVLGDVVLCPEVAARQAAGAGHELAGELSLLLTHGILHLLGHDHELPADHQVMFELQAHLIGLWQRAGGPAVSLPASQLAPAGPDPVQ